MNSPSYEYRHMSARKGAQSDSIGMPTTMYPLGNLYPEDNENVVE